MKTAFILNTKNGGVITWSNLLEREFPGDFELWPTEKEGDSRQLARQSAREAFSHVIAIGGDGTLNECANGLMDFKNDNPTIVLPEIGVIPNGTGNDFIRSIRRNSDLEALYDRMVARESTPLDLGVLDYKDRREYFVNIADAGIGPHVIDKVSRSKNRLGSSLTFATAIVKSFFTFKRQVLSCSGNSFHFSGPALAIVAANGNYFGGGLGIAPEASFSDGLLDVVIIGDVSILDYLSHIPQLKRSQKIDHPKIRYYKTPFLKIEGEGVMEKDGEMGFELPVEISIENGALRLVN